MKPDIHSMNMVLYINRLKDFNPSLFMKKLKRSLKILLTLFSLYLITYVINFILFDDASLLTAPVLIPWMVLSVFLIMLYVRGYLTEKRK